jgi:uncharacterized protein (TIGR02246 family)
MENDSRDEANIRALVGAWHRSTGEADLARVLTFIAEDAIFLRAGGPPIKGRTAFAEGLKVLLETHQIESKGEVREVRTSGDLAYCWADLTVAMTPIAGGEPAVRKGPALSIFRRQADGAWVLLRDANMLTPDSAELELKVDNLERELMADGPGGD